MNRREFLKRSLGGIIIVDILLISGCSKNPVNTLTSNIDKNRGSIHRIYGLNNFLDKDEKITNQNIKSLCEKFLEKNENLLENLLNISIQDLQLIQCEKRNDEWYINYIQYYKNIQVYRSSFGYTIYENGNIISIGSYVYPNISIDVNPKITKDKALNIAFNKFKKLSKINIPNIRKQPELMILPIEKENGYGYYFVYNIELEYINSTNLFSQAYFIDAKNGNIIMEYSNIKDADN